MLETEYIEKRNRLMEKCEQISIWSDSRLTRLFHFTSAGLFHLLPDVDHRAHEKIFKEILLTQQLSYLESHLTELPDMIQIDNLDSATDNLLKSSPVVVCTYHTGSYQLINLLLAMKGIRFSLVARQKTFKKFGTEYRELYGQNNGGIEGIDFINAESAHSVLRMLRSLKSGKSLVIYIDGNMGGGNPFSNKNSCEVNFLNRHLVARKGLAYIAHMANVPILGAISYRPNWNKIAIRFSDAIYPSKQTTREKFAVQNTQTLYGVLGDIVREFPGQWEGWLYLNNILDKLTDIATDHFRRITMPKGTILKNLRYNSEEFGVFEAGLGTYILDKKRFETFSIPSRIYDTLKEAQAMGTFSLDSLKSGTVNQLYRRGVLLSS